MKTCSKCKREKEDEEFYVSGGRLSRYCKVCHGRHCIDRQRERKLQVIEYLGGQCRKCGIKATHSNFVIFDLHHMDPMTKEKTKTRVTNWGLEKLKREADKCILLCANCHRLEHFVP